MSVASSLELSPQLTELRNRYLQLFSEAKEYKLAYGRWVISNLEKSQTNLWYAAIVNTFSDMQKNANNISDYLENPAWTVNLLNLRTDICKKAKRSGQDEKDFSTRPHLREVNLLANDIIEASKLDDDKASAVLRAAVKSDFMSNLVKNFKPASPEVNNYFNECVPKYLPQDFLKVSEAVEWFIKLSQITSTPEERQTYLNDAKSIPDIVKDNLASKRIELANEIRKITEEQLVLLVTDLKLKFF